MRLALVADEPQQTQALQDILENHGYKLAYAGEPSELPDYCLIRADVWLVSMARMSEPLDWFDRLQEQSSPVLFGVERVPIQAGLSRQRWQKRIIHKIQTVSGRMSPALEQVANELATDKEPRPTIMAFDSNTADKPILEDEKQKVYSEFRFQYPEISRVELPSCLNDSVSDKPEQVWILGASLGGPDAVKRFLDTLPAGLPVAFIYAQHIDPRFERTLVQAVGRHSELNVKLAVNGSEIRSGDCIVVPTQVQFNLVNGCIQLTEQKWEGPYGPSIDQVIDIIHKDIRENTRCIIFSGMGQDGYGGVSQNLSAENVWIQEPSSCACDSMPESLLQDGRASLIETPERLAIALVKQLEQERKHRHE